ncbi:hypothetical protein HMPREF0653_01805 [Prevotella disiens JCM 6334 = ATCC 29426]|uniref:Transposase DDE domain-containing protein n=1 Tax=Prevotella disiens JCM 6334 = ATCC 29426 TaxID=1235811 RepID=A0ABN0NQW7_9BACT|nr:hypothetical protein HMPREF0653_01805 [Prevotella disiens JCM 6334 = ATCC 29426]
MINHALTKYHNLPESSYFALLKKNVKFHQADTLERIMTRVKDTLGVTINRFRADCGSFSKDIIKTIEKHCNLFYIRANNCSRRYEDF